MTMGMISFVRVWTCARKARKLSQLAHVISVLIKSFIAAVYSRNKRIQNPVYFYSQTIFLMSGLFSLKMANTAL